MNTMAVARFTCFSFILLYALGAAPSIAQNTQQEEAFGDDEPVIEEIVVTGTRIKRRDFVSPSPLVTVSREDLEFSGQPTLEEYLNKLPQMQPITGRANNNGADGIMSLNLRGMGPGADQTNYRINCPFRPIGARKSNVFVACGISKVRRTKNPIGDPYVTDSRVSG
jgi:outer membrane receptor protein involved in Fe transport